MLRLVVVALAVVAVGGARAEADDGAAERGAAYLAPFKKELQQALRAGLADGPDNAIAACKEQAPAIASRLSVDGVVVGRTSHRLRNPDNVAPDWVSPVLASYLEADANPGPAVIPLTGERTGYVEPIVTQPPCLICHGEVIADELATRIQEAYPHDAATGFEVGDLRGVFWVEFAAD